MHTYDLLTREETSTGPQPWEVSRIRWLNHDRVEQARGDLKHWLDFPASSVMETVWDGLACPVTPLGKAFRYSCPNCLFSLVTLDSEDLDLKNSSSEDSWELQRCKPCERMRCAARTTANLTDACLLLRRHGHRVRMMTLTLPSRTVLSKHADSVRLDAFDEAKAMLRNAMRTAEWKDKVTGYIWSYEAPVRWLDCISGLMQTAPGGEHLVRNRAVVPVVVNPHFHILTVGEYWDQSEVSDWAVRAGFGPVADIRLIRSERGMRYSLKRAVTYASKESIYGIATRQSGGSLRAASQLTRYLWKHRTGKGPGSGLCLDELRQAFAAYEYTQQEGYD